MNSQIPSEIKVVIKGAGGHGVVVADILFRMYRAFLCIQPVAFIDDNQALHGTTVSGLKVCGAELESVIGEWNAVILAIGENRLRQKAFRRLKARGLRFASCKHPAATIAISALIEEGTMICAGAVINSETRIGSNVIVNTGCTIDHHNTIGDHAHIAPGANLGGGVRIGEGTLVGIGATVLPGCQIGAWNIIGGGAVVTEDTPDGITCCGVPAKPIVRNNLNPSSFKVKK